MLLKESRNAYLENHVVSKLCVMCQLPTSTESSMHCPCWVTSRLYVPRMDNGRMRLHALTYKHNMVTIVVRDRVTHS